MSRMDEMEQFEHTVKRTVRHLPYPLTPRLRTAPPQETARLYLRWTAAVFVLLASLLLIPPIRATVFDLLQIGAVRIWVSEHPPLPSVPTSLIDLAGETTLTEAIAHVRFTPRLPSDYGTPDRVYIQDSDGQALILVWLTPDAPDSIELALYQIGPVNAPAYGKMVSMAHNTEVHGQPAVWIAVPHLLQYQRGEYTSTLQTYLVRDNVLIWFEGGITYRLESRFTQAQAIAIAESLE